MVAYFFMVVILVTIIIVLIRMITKKWMPSNNYDSLDDNTEIRYTPYDDIIMGTTPDVRRDTPIKENNHHIDYVEEDDTNTSSNK
ncbi:hypothetical protein [Piscibacillus halophilus]|uniref:hypothetical protein n=1 Tax=Piscibacillus halophilus TaxID=571933 RepID=UPI00158E4E85|nr:hypothetical protein [Piscibacillus halophilus]